MTGNETKKPSKALLFGLLAWVPAAIYSALPSSTFGAPAQFNLTLPIAICLMFGLGTIDSDNWIEINLADPKIFSSHFVGEAIIVATNDSITVAMPKKQYCEIFFKSTGAFMDGSERERFAPGYVSAFQKSR
jgi:hypothetical protein